MLWLEPKIDLLFFYTQRNKQTFGRHDKTSRQCSTCMALTCPIIYDNKDRLFFLLF